jgi:hypothetical protein
MMRCASGAPVSLKRIGLNRLALCRSMGIVWVDALPERSEWPHRRPSRGCHSLLRDGESSVMRRLGRVGAAWRCAWPGIEATAPLRLDATSRFDMTRAERLSGHDESQGHRRPLNFGRISVTRICPIAQAGHSVRDLPVSAS